MFSNICEIIAGLRVIATNFIENIRGATFILTSLILPPGEKYSLAIAFKYLAEHGTWLTCDLIHHAGEFSQSKLCNKKYFSNHANCTLCFPLPSESLFSKCPISREGKIIIF